MKIRFEKSDIKNIKADAYIFLVYQDKALFDNELRLIQRQLKCKISGVSLEDFLGKEKQTTLLYLNDHRVILSGVGLKEKSTLEKVRKATARGVKKAKSLKIKKLAIEILQDELLEADIEDVAGAETISAILSLYSFDKYFTKKDSKEIPTIKEIILFAQSNLTSKYLKEIERGIKSGSIIGNSTNFARDLGNEPSNIIYPESLADLLVERSQNKKYSVEVLDKKAIEDLKMGGVLEVARGSDREPRFLILKYNGGQESDRPVVIIGKGVTFDSGGISIKPAAGMALMKMDMGGAAAVIGIFEAISQLGVNQNVIGLIPSVENMPGGNSFKPGDIITAYNGMTIEVDNTDAEGRLILADALAYASKFDPKYVIDMATLTGAAVIAIGSVASIVMGNNQNLIDKLFQAGEQTYDRVWQLPLWEEYDKMIDSDVADVKNTGTGRQAGTITAGMFLKRFVSDYPWAHIDIAATAMRDSESDYDPKNATGSGVRLVTQFLVNDSKGN